MDVSIFKFGNTASAAEPTQAPKRAQSTERSFGSVLSSERAAERASAKRDESNRFDAADRARADRARNENMQQKQAPKNDVATSETATGPGVGAETRDGAVTAKRNGSAPEARERATLRSDGQAENGQTGLLESSESPERGAETGIGTENSTENSIENGRYEETHQLIEDEYGLSGVEGTEGAEGTVGSSVTETAAHGVALEPQESGHGYGAQALGTALLSNSASGIVELGARLGSLSLDGTTDAATDNSIDESAEESTALTGSVVSAEALTDSSDEEAIASILLGSAHRDGRTGVPWTAIHSDIGTDTRLSALSDHFETLPKIFETLAATLAASPEEGESDEAVDRGVASSIVGSGIGSGTGTGEPRTLSVLGAEELAFRIDGLGTNKVDVTGTGTDTATMKLLGGSTATTEKGSGNVVATVHEERAESVASVLEASETDGDDLAAALTDALPESMPEELPEGLQENLIDAFGDDPAASTPGLGAQLVDAAEAGKQYATTGGTEAKAAAFHLGVTDAGTTGAGATGGRVASGMVVDGTDTSEAEAGETGSSENGETGSSENGENREAEQGLTGRSGRGSAKGIENAVERLRENRTASDANGIKRLIEQAEAGAEADGNGNEANAKPTEGQQNGLKGEGNGTGGGGAMGRGGVGAFGGAQYGSGDIGSLGKGSEGTTTLQDFAALMARDGELRSMSFTETVRAATTGATAAEGVENTVKVYEKFAQAIKLSFLGGGKQVNLRLSPEHLGNLQIKLTGDGTNVTAKIIVDSVAVKNLLESDAGKLKELFNQQGLNMEEYTVEVREQSIGANDSRGADLWERHGNSDANRRDRGDTVTVPVETAVIKASVNATYGLGASRGVDLFA
ncbi:MAG: flagellar hook-length control protein FliK [Proteobacteria bacterium]|nr:flagellar hook-length control protein FliK [Pseudomonadota bacterium]